MSIATGSSLISAVNLGTNTINRLYLGSSLVYSVGAERGAMPAWNSGGTVLTNATLPATYTVNIPTHSSGDLLILLGLARNTNNDGAIAVNTAGWTQIGTGMSGGTQNARIAAWYKIGNGSETGVSITGSGGTSTDRILARVHRFTAANGFAATPVQGPASLNGGGASQTSMNMPSVTASGNNELAVCVYGISNNSTVANATGESGGDWTEPVAEDSGTNGTIGLQTAGLASGGTLSGGTSAITSSHWVTLAFTLVPADVGAPPAGVVFDTSIGAGFGTNFANFDDSAAPTVSITLAADHDLVLAWFVTWSGAAPTGVTFGGVAMNLLSNNSDGNLNCRVYYLLDASLPAAGSRAWAPTFSGNVNGGLDVCALKGAAQSAPAVTPNSSTSNGSLSAAVTLSSTSGLAMLIGGWNWSGVNATYGAGQTEIGQGQNTAAQANWAWSRMQPTINGSNSLSESTTDVGANHRIIAIGVNPA